MFYIYFRFDKRFRSRSNSFDTSFTAQIEGLEITILGQQVFFKFINLPSYENVNALKQISISKIINNINYKKQHIKFLKEEIRHKRIIKQI